MVETVAPTHIVFGAEFSDFGQVARVRNHHSSLSLDRLNHEGCHIWVLESILKERKNSQIYSVRHSYSTQGFHTIYYMDDLKPKMTLIFQTGYFMHMNAFNVVSQISQTFPECFDCIRFHD